MSAALALARAEAAGVRFRLASDGAVRMEAAAPPPPDVLAELRRWRADVAAMIARRDVPAPARPASAAPGWWTLPYGSDRGRAFAAARFAPGACRCCAGVRWWSGEGAQAAPRCLACHPPPPGLAFAVSGP